MNYQFITVTEFIEFIKAHPGKELGFTSDSMEDIMVQGGPEGWYGAKIDKSFGGDAMLIGDYGIGTVFCRYILEDDDYFDGLVEFFANEFSKGIAEDSLICVDVEDLM